MRYLIIGNCIAGINAATSIRNLDTRNDVTIISDEKYPAYGRCLISYYLAGTHREKDILLKEKDFYQTSHIELLLKNKVTSIEPESKRVVLKNGKKIKYDKLLLATGARAVPLGVEGENKKGVFRFRTLDDAKSILKLVPSSQRALVFGGGLIGLKTGYALKKQGLDVEIIVKSPFILSRVADRNSAQLITSWLIDNGIKIRTGLGPRTILGNKWVEGVVLDSGEKEECQIIIAGKGVISNMEMADNVGIRTHWGIVTDSFLKTSMDNIYAAGDVAETRDLVTGEYVTSARWTSAAEQGRIAGLNMAGEPKEYPGSIPCNSAEFFGLPIISMGHVQENDEGYETTVRSHPGEYRYKKIVVHKDRLVGAILIGRVENAGVYLALIRKKADISCVKHLLLEDWFDYGKVSHLIEGQDGFRESMSIGGDIIRIS
jgi:NAD(P)H-nitrite reductase large subunit